MSSWLLLKKKKKELSQRFAYLAPLKQYFPHFTGEYAGIGLGTQESRIE